MFNHNLAMLKESFVGLQDTGCLLSSSVPACRALSQPIRDNSNKRPAKILEVGAGSGSATLQILEAMGSEDTLVVCELRENLIDALKKTLDKSEHYHKHKERVTIFHGPIQELPEPEQKFDFIVCALPFLNFTEELLEEIFSKFYSLSKEDTVMTYFEYIGIRPASVKLSPPKRRKRMKAVNSFVKNLLASRAISTEIIWLNVPPIHVYTINLGIKPQSH